MMRAMPTRYLKLRLASDGYYRTSWVDDSGQRHWRRFGVDARRARSRFSAFHAAWKADDMVRNPGAGPLTISAAWDLFAGWADGYYRRADGTATGELREYGYSMQLVLDEYGDLAAANFGPKALKRIRVMMAQAGWSRRVINHRVNRVRRVWAWLVSEELVPGTVWHALRAVRAIDAGRAVDGDSRVFAREKDAVGPVPDHLLWPVIDVLTPTLKTMVLFQYYTGCRPGEVCALRPVDLARDVYGGRVWIYKPPQHKTSWRGRTRQIIVGPKAQQIIEPFMQRDLTAPCFSPRESEQQRHAECETHRRQPVQPARTDRKVGQVYDSCAYAHAIVYACRRAFPPPAEITDAAELAAWRREHYWSPGQLRHNAATRLRNEFGYDVAGVVLGHSRGDVTAVYAEVDIKRAVAVMERVG